jgi:hypothetical protein
MSKKVVKLFTRAEFERERVQAQRSILISTLQNIAVEADATRKLLDDGAKMESARVCYRVCNLSTFITLIFNLLEMHLQDRHGR